MALVRDLRVGPCSEDFCRIHSMFTVASCWKSLSAGFTSSGGYRVDRPVTAACDCFMHSAVLQGGAYERFTPKYTKEPGVH